MQSRCSQDSDHNKVKILYLCKCKMPFHLEGIRVEINNLSYSELQTIKRIFIIPSIIPNETLRSSFTQIDIRFILSFAKTV